MSSPIVPEERVLPRHIAIVMDGNGRWARKRMLPRVAGHARGLEAVRRVVRACAERGIAYLTLFAFSSENWKRPEQEVHFLMDLFMTALKQELTQMHDNQICLRVVGDMAGLEAGLHETIRQAEEMTAGNTRMVLTVCVDYGGKWDIVQALQKMTQENPDPSLFTQERLASHLAMAYAPDPDLFIRTGGEQRISNFLLWQLAYTELYFTDVFWPDFDTATLDQAIAAFQSRERRFGRISEQLTA
ncbi:MAG: di-trans,poly-cis-decaprenylcistransferase [Burkholderiaceae bacterium]|jgi:undecaprenyl diphosphate synthase|nr:di-trans,poly-cis-decaprenylcistransferase [Burkholderiaceae bacterium]